MALVAQRPHQPEVNSAPPSPTSSISTMALAPRPIQLTAAGVWEAAPSLTEKDSHPSPTSEPTIGQGTAVPTMPTSTPNLIQIPPTTKVLPEPTPSAKSAMIASTIPRSILKPGDVHPAHRPSAESPTTTSSSSDSLVNTSKTKPNAKPPGKRSRGKSIKEGAFYAFVLLPLSCWYTRGGKRLRSAAPIPGSSARGGVGGKKSEMVEWGDDIGEEDDDEEDDERRVRVSSTQEMRRSMHGRNNSLGQGSVGGARSNVVGRRQSFSASVPSRVAVGSSAGHGRSNSMSTTKGSGAGSGFVAPRREFADYGVDKGAAAVDGGDADLDLESDRFRLSKNKSRTGSPVPLRRRMSEF